MEILHEAFLVIEDISFVVDIHSNQIEFFLFRWKYIASLWLLK
jgi:hypothetical protein